MYSGVFNIADICLFHSDLLCVFYARNVTGLPFLPKMPPSTSHRRPLSFCMGPGVIARLVY